jgi:hypothetical protein
MGGQVIIDTKTIPTHWKGVPLGIDERSNEPRNLGSYLIQALCESNLAGVAAGGVILRSTPDELLERYTLTRAIERSEGKLTVSERQFQLLRDCVTVFFAEVASVRLIGVLDESSEFPEDENRRCGRCCVDGAEPNDSGGSSCQ